MGRRKEESGYTTNQWAGNANYECGSCDFATLDEEKMKDHVKFHGNPVKASTASPEEVATPAVANDESEGGES